jgi:ferric-dicitrate binding protein FerR (iron transport regulator)
MRKKLPADLLERFFSGSCNEQETAEIRSWYESFDHDNDDVSELSEEEQQQFKKLMWGNISSNINTAENDNVIQFGSRRLSVLKTAIYWLSGVAAMVAIVFFVKFRPQTVNVVQQSNPAEAFSNNTSTIQQITLSDGSRVWVSPKSTLTYPKAFEKLSRRVSLTGEAFFEVTKDHKRPFSILTGKVITKVWGTSFRIRAYAADKITRVNVVTGKVSVSVNGQSNIAQNMDKVITAGKTEEIMLLPNQEAVYNKTADNLEKNLATTDASIGMWKKASLSFNNTPLSEVFRVLNKSFNVNISSTDKSINADLLKADFSNENLPTILAILKRTLNVNYQVNGNNFIMESEQQ